PIPGLRPRRRQGRVGRRARRPRARARTGRPTRPAEQKPFAGGYAAAAVSGAYVFRLFGTKRELFKAAVSRCLSETLEAFEHAAEGRRAGAPLRRSPPAISS